MRVPLLIAAFLLSACASKIRIPLDEGVPDPSPQDALTVEFTGVGSFLIRSGGLGVLTDPYWSHYGMGQVAFGHVPPDPAQIDPWVGDLSDMRAVLVGHGHYDHVSDLAYVAPSLHPDAVVLASQTVKHTFATSELPRPILPVNPHAGDFETQGAWMDIAEGRARVLPLRSGHPAQYLMFHLFTKRLTEDRDKPPTRARHFQEGETFAYLVDFLDAEGGIDHRVFVETSSTGVPAGAVPPGILDERAVDVALVSMDVGRDAADGVETVLDQLQPHTVVFCHWDDFFRTKEEEPREIVKVNLAKIRAALVDTPERRYLFPAWGAVFAFEAGQ